MLYAIFFAGFGGLLGMSMNMNSYFDMNTSDEFILPMGERGGGQPGNQQRGVQVREESHQGEIAWNTLD